MLRYSVLLAVALALGAPVAVSAQSQTDRDRERIERERERANEARERQRERARERAQEASDRAQEARDRAQESRDREEERRDRDHDRAEMSDAAGALDTVVAFDSRGMVTVSCPGGAVVVTAADRNEIRVHARTRSGSIRFTSTSANASLEPWAGRGCSNGRFEIVVPTGSRVSANTMSGSISVRGVSGDVDAHTLSGEIAVHDAGSRLDVESLSGDVVVTNVKGDASVHTVSSGISLSGARGGVEVETVSGDLDLRDVTSREVRAHTTSGDVSFAGSIIDAGRYEFNTHSGEVRLQLPTDVGAQLSVSTFSGGIESDFPITLAAGEHGSGSSHRGRLNFTLGRGSAHIIAETFSGGITITSAGRRR